MRIFVIGSGRMANALAPALLRGGHSITGVYSRNVKSGSSLARYLGCEFSSTLNVPKNTDLILLAVHDDATPILAKSLKRTKSIIVHTSGAVDVSSLARKTKGGVFYPLDTMNGKRNINFQNIPICIEATDEKTLATLLALANSITKEVYVMDSKTRMAVHAAAVFTNNFTNHLLGMASAITNQVGAPFNILKKLAQTTVKNAFAGNPLDAQTGPAKRGDQKTIKKHLDFLAKNPKALKLYATLTKSIAAVHKNKAVKG
ncbi:MAG: Rossmann-like and DUF2520 domain-containing protein [Bacteroidota bacterium]